MAQTKLQLFQMNLEIRDQALIEMKESLALLKETIAEMPKMIIDAQINLANSALEEFRDAHRDARKTCPNKEQIQELMAASKDASKVHLETLSVLHGALKLLAPKKLPDVKAIKLDIFDGRQGEWMEWRGLFEREVLNTGLEPSDKIQLLLSALDGEAKSTAGKSEIRDEAELQRIWGKLVLTYDNPYHQVPICTHNKNPLATQDDRG